MSSYENIAAYYDHIFIHSRAKTDFIVSGLSRLPGHPGTGDLADVVAGGFLLDIGCGTGELVIDLAGRGAKVVGIDGEVRMIDYANEKIAKLKIDTQNDHEIECSTDRKPTFIRMDMRSCGSEFTSAAFDGISCLGNTLVHLSGEMEIAEFLATLKTILKPSGILTLQIVNYQMIFETDRHELPVIENEIIRFERYYDFEPNGDSVDFRTTLEIKESGKRIESTSTLYPLGHDRLLVLLEESGFTKLDLFENFSGNPFTPKSMSVLIRARQM